MKFSLLRTAPKIFLIWLLIAVQACNNDPDPVIPQGSAGYFVVNEGAFNGSNTSISFFDRATGTITNDVFASVNGRTLGDQAQSMTVFEGKGYIAVQNSAKIEVINTDDFKSTKTITENIESPRYFLGLSSTKGYVTDWGTDGTNGTVKVIDLNNFTVTKTVSTGKGSNKMLLKDGKVYVANNGGFASDSTVVILDPSTDAVTTTIKIADNPNSIAFDSNGNLWVAGIGNYFDTKPWIAKVGTDNKVAFILELPEMAYTAPTIVANKAGDKVYVNNSGSVYAMATSATALPATAFIQKDFYGLAVDPITDELIGAEAPDFKSAGTIYVYDAAGTMKTSYKVGIAPNGVAFK